MRTDWNLTVSAFIERASIPGSIGALDQYIDPPGFVIETTKLLDVETRTTNIFVGVDSSGLYVGQDVLYVPGLIYPNTKIIQIIEGINIIDSQQIEVGISTTRLFNVDTSLLNFGLKLLKIQNIIDEGTSIISIDSNSVEIFPPSLNTTGIITSTISFYEGSGEYSITLSARTTNNFDQFANLDFGIGTIVGIGSTFIFNADAFFPSGNPKIFVGDQVSQLSGIIGLGYTVTGITTYVNTSSIIFKLKTEISPYYSLQPLSSTVNVGGISTLVAIGDFVRGPHFDPTTIVTSISGNNVSFVPPSLNTFIRPSSVGFTRSANVSQISDIVGINTKGIFENDFVVSEVTEPDTFVVSIGSNEITLNQSTINGSETTGDIGITTDIITGINTSRIEVGYEILEIPGVISVGTTIIGFPKEVVTIHIQENEVGILTTKLFNIGTVGLQTTGIVEQTKLLAVPGIIAQGTYVTSVVDPISEYTTFDSTIVTTFDSEEITFDAFPIEGYIEILPKTLNNLGIATTTLTFFNEIYNVSISTFTQNTTPIEEQLLNIFLTTTPEFLFGNYELVETFKNNILLNTAGINTTPVGIATFTFGFIGDVARVTTAEDYGDLLDVTFVELDKEIQPEIDTIQVNTSQISEGQYLKAVTGVFDNESGTFVEEVNQNSIRINVGSSNSITENVTLKIGNLITKESKRYSFDEFTNYTIQFLTEFPRAFETENTTAFPAYGNPPGSANGDPSLRFSFTSNPKEFDINKTLGQKDFPYDITSRQLAAARGRRNYEGPVYPRHVFGR
jgi:hypothetical protein